jgi:hypothetical protein
MVGKGHPPAMQDITRARHNEALNALAQWIEKDICDIRTIEGKTRTGTECNIATQYRTNGLRPDMILQKKDNHEIFIVDMTYPGDRGLIQEDEWIEASSCVNRNWDKWDKHGILKEEFKQEQLMGEPEYHKNSGVRQQWGKPPHICSRAKYYHRYGQIATLNEANLMVVAIGVCGWTPTLTRNTLSYIADTPMTKRIMIKEGTGDTMACKLIDIALRYMPKLYREWCKHKEGK